MGKDDISAGGIEVIGLLLSVSSGIGTIQRQDKEKRTFSGCHLRTLISSYFSASRTRLCLFVTHPRELYERLSSPSKAGCLKASRWFDGSSGGNGCLKAPGFWTRLSDAWSWTMHLPKKRNRSQNNKIPIFNKRRRKSHTQKSEAIIETASALIKALVRDSKPLEFV